jgi:hypothetical protein
MGVSRVVGTIKAAKGPPSDSKSDEVYTDIDYFSMFHIHPEKVDEAQAADRLVLKNDPLLLLLPEEGQGSNCSFCAHASLTTIDTNTSFSSHSSLYAGGDGESSVLSLGELEGSSPEDFAEDEDCLDDRPDGGTPAPPSFTFRSLRFTYLLVTLVIMLADGLQGKCSFRVIAQLKIVHLLTSIVNPALPT